MITENCLHPDNSDYVTRKYSFQTDLKSLSEFFHRLHVAIKGEPRV